MLNRHRRSAGVTLVELIVALVIIGVALAGMVAVYTATTRSSTDPVIVQQMEAVADNMMEEILMKPFARQPGMPAPAAADRASYNTVSDYDGYGANLQGVRDVEGNQIPGLERYNFAISVKPAALTNVPSQDALRIVVTVTVSGTDPSLPKPLVLTGWRTNPS
jgi:MSHA pilin protein MshD